MTITEPMARSMDELPDAPPSVRVEVRCPVPQRGCRPGKLFAVLMMSGQEPSYIHPDNLIEMACLDCKQELRRTGRVVRQVRHRYDFAGNLVDTILIEE